MAQLLYEQHSVNVHLNTVKRHIRLLRQIQGGEELAVAIEPHYNNLLEKNRIKNGYAEEAEFKRDTVILKDSILDDRVRDTFEGCKKYDRAHPGLTITQALFPHQLTGIIYAPFNDEPTEVEKMVEKLKEFGEGHDLTAFIAPLEQAVSECKEALTELQYALGDLAKATAHENFAKFNLMRQYEQNFFSAGTKFGKQYSDRVFPVVRSKSKIENGTIPEEPKK